MNNHKSSRVVLDQEAQEYLNKMLLVLRSEEDGVKISPSRLTSWIVSYFAKRDFSRQKERITRESINSKEYLRNIAKGLGDSDDLETVLKEALNQIRSRKGGKSVRKESYPEDTPQGRS